MKAARATKRETILLRKRVKVKVPGEGVEPTHHKVLDPKSSASASSAIQAFQKYRDNTVQVFVSRSRLFFEKVFGL
jgi:hypothetical protein